MLHPLSTLGEKLRQFSSFARDRENHGLSVYSGFQQQRLWFGFHFCPLYERCDRRHRAHLTVLGACSKQGWNALHRPPASTRLGPIPIRP